MRSKLLIAAGVVSLSLGGLTPAFASGSPGPNGHNNNGLCEAAGSGSAQGQAQKQAHGVAFQALAAAGEADESTSQQANEQSSGAEGTSSDTSQDIQTFCGSSFG